MQSILRATAILSSTSLVSILVGLVSAKIWAVLLGPNGIGNMGLLQSLVGLAGLIAGMGIGVGIVRMGANALAREEHAQVDALHRAAWLLSLMLGGLALLILIMCRVPISRWMLGGPEHSGNVVLMGLALLFNLASGMQTSILNAYHRITALAKVAVLNSVIGTGVSLIPVWLWREQGIAPAIIAGSAAGLAISTYALRNEVARAVIHPTYHETLMAAKALLRFGVPYTASMLVGTGVQFALPALALHALGSESVGFYRAAVAVSVNYLGFLIYAMGQDYYPRVSAVSDDPLELVRLINQQHRLVMLVAGPIVLGTLAIAPYLIPIIYSPRFASAVSVLEWQLIGDLFKFSSWTMGTVILARSGSIVLFVVEFISGLNILIASWFGMRWFGLAGLGIAFLITYVVHYVVVWAICRKEINLFWSLESKIMMLWIVSAALSIRILPLVNLEHVRTPIALSIALVSAVGALYMIWQEVGGSKYVQAWR